LRDDLNDILMELEEDCKSSEKYFSIMVMDIDHFKMFNDKHGHLFGDEALRYFSSMMRVNLDDFKNIPFRFGGDEFVMLFPEQESQLVIPLANRLRENMQIQPFIFQGVPRKISFSAGVATFPRDGATWEQVFENADKAMYFSKKNGRGRVTQYPEISRESIVWGTSGAVILAIASLVIFLNFHHNIRDFFISANAEIRSLFEQTPEAKEPEPMAIAPVQAPPPTPMEASPTANTPRIYAFHLKTGGVIKGRIASETPEQVHILVQLSGGRGDVKLERDNILSIEEVKG
jgi:diguanylate cyclase (GGDEF)-like protein